MTHLHHRLGKIKIEHPLLTIVEDDEPDDDCDGDEVEVENTETDFTVIFHGSTLDELAQAYRELGVWLDARYADEAAA